MDRFVYEAIFTKENDDGYYVNFPDLDGAYTSGDDLRDAVSNAAEVLELIIAGYLDEGQELPIPQFKGSTEDEFRIGISVVVTEEMRERMKCVTPTEAASMLGISKGRVSQMLNAGLLQSIPFGNERLVTLASINQRLDNPKGSGRPKKTVL